jgi:hypothetical protein
MQLIDFKNAEKLLLDYKILYSRTFFVLTKKEALVAAKKIKYPVFLKVYGKHILHRIELGGTKEVRSPAELSKTFLVMKKIKGVDGILVQEKVIGKNIILGMKRDAQFGPVILVGIGGTLTEVLNDIVLRVAPVSLVNAMDMLKELKGYSYLCGKRDKKSVNLKDVAKIIVALSNLAIKEGKIKEIDVNPVIANEKKATAVDFKFLI